jgi:hypothetical protein
MVKHDSGGKEDGENKRLDEDKKGDSKEEEEGSQTKESEVFFGGEKELAR